MENIDDPEMTNTTITMDENKALTANFEIEDDTEEDESEEEKEDGWIPGFTLTILLLATIIAGIVYKKKSERR